MSLDYWVRRHEIFFLSTTWGPKTRDPKAALFIDRQAEWSPVLGFSFVLGFFCEWFKNVYKRQENWEPSGNPSWTAWTPTDVSGGAGVANCQYHWLETCPWLEQLPSAKHDRLLRKLIVVAARPVQLCVAIVTCHHIVAGRVACAAASISQSWWLRNSWKKQPYFETTTHCKHPSSGSLTETLLQLLLSLNNRVQLLSPVIKCLRRQWLPVDGGTSERTG